MGQWCMVLFCNNSSDKKPGLSFFSLTSRRYHSWMNALGRDPNVEKLSHGNLICEEHFVSEDFIYSNEKKRLKPNAVPSLNLGPRKPLSTLQDSSGGLSSVTQSGGSGLLEISMKDIASTSSVIDKDSVFTLMADKENIGEQSRSSSSLSQSVRSTPPLQETYGDYDLLHKKKKLKLASSSDSEGFKGTPKKIRRNIKTMHTYSITPQKIGDNLKNVELSRNKIRSKLKTMKERVNRLTKKVTHLKEIVWHLKDKKMLTNEALDVLEMSYSGIPLNLMKRYISNAQKTAKGKKQGREKFPEELRSFALTLQFYSSKAYNYVRKVFSLALPAPSTIRSWLSNINCEPGFTECSFISLKRIVEKNKLKNQETLCALVIDEMAIKKQIEVVNNNVWGYEDIGTGVSDDELKCATEAFVLMVVSVNDNWKLPIAYFLISSLTASEKSNIVKDALTRLYNVGVRITLVTCDGPTANFKMATQLGAEVTDINKIKPYFKHPVDSSNIYLIFDACHMIKLLRNNWSTSNVFIDRKGRRIDFKLIHKLHDLQESEVCKFGNKYRLEFSANTGSS